MKSQAASLDSASVAAAVAQLQDRFGAERPRSKELFERAARVMPGGNSRTQVYFPPFPFYVAGASGCRLTDVDGFTYLDLVGNYTSLVHGHSGHGAIGALNDQLERGTAYGAPSPVEIDLAEELCSRVPSLETLRFTNSGTEAVMYACRTARVFTGRDELIRAEGSYGGGYDDMNVGVRSFSDDGRSLPEAGVPQWVADHTHLLPFNDPEQAAAVIREHGPRCAAVVLEPVQGYAGYLTPSPGFLEAVREECDAAGCLLIFDEVLSLRVAYGGAQELFGVTPDITALGKIIGGGLPVGAFGGRGDVMGTFDPRGPAPTFHSGTFNANPMTLTAGLAYVRQLSRPALARVNEAGDTLRSRINATARRLGLPVVVSGTGSLFQLFSGTEPPRSSREAQGRPRDLTELLFHLLLEDGVFIGTKRGVFSLTTAMSDADLGEIGEAFDRAMESAAAVPRR